MEDKKLNEVVENIEIFLEATTKSNEEIIREIREFKNSPKTAQILDEASKQHKLLLDEFKGLISKEKQLLDNFKPTVEVKQHILDVKSPLKLVVSLIITIIVLVGLLLVVNDMRKDEKREKEEITKDFNTTYDNYIKYECLSKFGDKYIKEKCKDLDNYYKKNRKECIDKALSD